MKILIADDDAIIRMVIKQYFNNKNIEVIAANDGEDALIKFNNAPSSFDLIITDIMMPMMNGIELASKIKERDPSIPIIVITAGNLNQINGSEFLFELSYNKPLELSKLHEDVLGILNRNSYFKG
jgi:two-component system capsular synthesis sensor histidine kinase RcsC